MSYRYPNIIQSVKQIPTDEPMPVMRWARTNFFGAGMDNFAQPPSQDPDMMQQLTNTLPVVNGAVQRRWGYSLWDSDSIIPISHMYSYQSDVTQLREIILTTPASVVAQNEDGSDYNEAIFTPILTPRAVVSRSYAHFASGAQQDRQTWNGGASTNTDNWGIDVNNVASSIAGPDPASTAADQGSSGGTGSIGPNSPTTAVSIPAPGGFAWSNPTNADALDSQYATVTLIPPHPGFPATTQLLQVTGFNFAVPAAATITGVIASVVRGSLGGSSQTITDEHVMLIVGGTASGTNHGQSVLWPTIPTATAYGTSSDLWGNALTPAIVNASNFGLSFQAIADPAVGSTAAVDYISLTVYYTAPSTLSWTNPNNILVQDGAVAVATATTSATSPLRATGFGFAISTGLDIAGIQVDLKMNSPDGTPTVNAQLVQNGLAYGATKQVTLVTSPTLAFSTYGGQADLWGGQWTAANVNAANFGVQFTAVTTSGSATINLDFVQITIYTGLGPIVAMASGVGSINLLQGRIYFVVFQKSHKPITSDLNPPSLITGPVTNQNIALSGIPVSLDPQCDTKLILGTADGGNEERLYLVGSIPNATTTFTDTLPDSNTTTYLGPTLLAQPVYLSTDTTGAEFGVPNNDRPPLTAQFPIQHRGNIYMASATTLFWSKSLADVTTDTNTITTRWEEAWPPANQLDVSGQAEKIAGMLSDGVNLYIGTEKKIRRVNGSAPFLEPPDIVHNEVGIANQDVWQIVFSEGSPVGAMWLTPDFRVIGSDFNTYSDVGTPIQTTLNSINRAAIGASYASFYSNGPFDLYLLSIPTGTNTACDTTCVYNLRTQKWGIWQLTDTLSSLLFNITVNGTPQLLLATSTGAIYYLDPTVTQDRVGNTAVNFTAFIQTSWLDLGDPVLRKILNEIEITTSSSAMLVTVEGASTGGEFLVPRSVIGTAPLVLSPRGEYKVYLASSPSVSRYYRFSFTSTDAISLLIDSMNVEFVPVNRQ